MVPERRAAADACKKVRPARGNRRCPIHARLRHHVAAKYTVPVTDKLQAYGKLGIAHGGRNEGARRKARRACTPAWGRVTRSATGRSSTRTWDVTAMRRKNGAAPPMPTACGPD